MNIGKAFKEIREEAELSRPALAKKLGVTPGALWKIEAGKSVPKQKTVAKLCYLRRIPLARFYTLAFEKNDFNLIGVAEQLSSKDIFDVLRG